MRDLVRTQIEKSDNGVGKGFNLYARRTEDAETKLSYQPIIT